jgi:hypothetical protein
MKILIISIRVIQLASSRNSALFQVSMTIKNMYVMIHIWKALIVVVVVAIVVNSLNKTDKIFYKNIKFIILKILFSNMWYTK